MGLLDGSIAVPGLLSISNEQVAPSDQDKTIAMGLLGAAMMRGRFDQGMEGALGYLGDAPRRALIGAQLDEAKLKTLSGQYDLQRLMNWDRAVNGGGQTGSAPGSQFGPNDVRSPGAFIPPTDGVGPTLPISAAPAALTAAPQTGWQFGLRGMNDAQSRAIAASMRPDEYMKLYAQQNAPQTDIEKLMAAQGIDRNSPMGQQLLSDATQKVNYMAPTAFRGGGYIFDPTTRTLRQLPQAPEGYTTAQNADGTFRLVPLQGGTDAVTGSTSAKARGTAQLNPTQVWDDKLGKYVFSNQALDADRAYGAGGSVQGTGVQGNNFGNLRPPGAAQGFQSFQTPEQGLAAIDSQLKLYGQRGLNTVQSVISTWAPPSENDTASYVKNVSSRLGVSPTQPLDMNNPVVRLALTNEIIRQEQGPQRIFGSSSAGTSQYSPKPAPGQVESLQGIAQGNVQRFNSTINQASDSPTRANVYDNILSLSRNGVNTGPGEAWKQSVKGYIANTPFLSAVTPDKWKDDVSGFQELQKFLYQNAQRNWQAAGGTGTDAQLEAFSHSNPNDKMFPQALQAMAQWGKAGELALQGKADAMQQWKDQNSGNVANLDQFERTWRNNFDPVLFQLKTMDDAQRQSFVGNLKLTNPQAYKALMAKAQALKQLGGL